MDDQYCLKWNSHMEAISDIAFKFLEHESLVDVTLVCQEYNQTHFFKAHQIILSACSPYFESLFLHNTHPHPIVYLKDVRKSELEIILMFMYRGEVNVQHDKIKDVLETAKSLMIRGLGDDVCEHESNAHNSVKSENMSPTYYRNRKRKSDELSPKIGIKENCEEYKTKYSQCVSPASSYNSPVRNSETINCENECKNNPMDYSYRDCPNNQDYQTLRPYDNKTNPDNYETSTNPELFRKYYCSNNNSNENREIDKKHYTSQYNTSQEISVIQENSINNENTLPTGSINVSSTPVQVPKRTGHFQLKWMELFAWLKYDPATNKMFCKFCRKWGDLIPNIRRTSFVDGSCNFRFEIVKHHDSSKSHKICVNKEETNSVNDFY